MNYKIAALQLGSIFSTILVTIAGIALFHHQTDDYAVPFIRYLGSIRVAIPPLGILFISYILFFIGGIKLSEAPALVIRYLRNVFFQSNGIMLIYTTFCVLASTSVFIYTSASAPSSYVRLVSILLGGEEDRQTNIIREINILKQKNNELANQLLLVSEVFDERSTRNFKNQTLNTTKPRIFVRALEANLKSKSWEAHPLRKLALAEAYSMWAQAAFASPLRTKDNNGWRAWLDRSIELNTELEKSKHRLTTQLLKHSAMHNKANSLLYTNNLDDAKTAYENVLAVNKNLSSGGNLIALYAILGDAQKAVSVGDEFREWGLSNGKALIETSAFSSVVGNTAFSSLIIGDYEKAVDYFIETYDLEADDLNALNLAASLILSGDVSAAEIALSHFKYPLLDLGEQALRVNEDFNSCYYLIRALSLSKDKKPELAAHLYTYLGLARTEEQLSNVNEYGIVEIQSTVLEALAKDSTPCGYFNLIPEFRAKLMR